MKRIAFFMLAVVVLTSCQNQKKEMAAAQLKNDSLQQLLNLKDSSLFAFSNTMSSIETNLQEIKEKENLITLTATDDVESRVSKEDKINQDIQDIYNLMIENKQKIKQLEAQLRKAKVNEKDLNNTIAALNQRLLEKDAEILELQQKLAEMDIKVAELNYEIDTLLAQNAQSQELIKIKDQALQAAYYVIGTAKELKEMGIVEGKIIGKDVSQDFDKQYFTQVNILEDTVINLSSKKVQILSVHPSESYTITGEELAESIQIKDPWNFWSVSKYLVILVK